LSRAIGGKFDPEGFARTYNWWHFYAWGLFNPQPQARIGQETVLACGCGLNEYIADRNPFLGKAGQEIVMSLGFPSDNSGAREYSEEKKPEPEANRVEEDRENTELLEQVLAATLQLTGPDEPLQPEEMRALVNVAKQRKNEPLSVETIMELVQSALRLRFRRLAGTTAQWEHMTRQIAQTLFEDPQAKSRLQQLWDRLCEAAK
jgi:hypothetical protein